MKFDKDKMARLLVDLEAIPPFDSLGHCLSEKRFQDKLILAQVTMPYGKYKDKKFRCVPLKYLNDIVSVRNSHTLLARSATEFVYLCMIRINELSKCSLQTVPNNSARYVFGDDEVSDEYKYFGDDEVSDD